jgi:hypothetical protein
MGVKLKEIEGAMKDLVLEIKEALNVNDAIDEDVCPGDLIKSDALMTVPGRLNARLGIAIPLNCYPFFDKKDHKQLSIREAARKVFNLLKNGK